MMHKSFMFLILASLALAQGGEQTTARLLHESTAGPGFIQQEFVASLWQELADAFSPERADRMVATLRRQKLKPRHVMQLLNGQVTRSTLKNYFGVGGREIERVDKAVENAVDTKNRSLFFGVMLYTMLKEFDVNPTAEFCKQTCAARTELDDDDFRQLRTKVRSRKLIAKCFKLEDREDQKFMREILMRMQELPFFGHPICASLGSGLGYHPRRFPKLAAGMPGHGDEFAKGEAGGLPFDPELAPCPFFGSNIDKYFRR